MSPQKKMKKRKELNALIGLSDSRRKSKQSSGHRLLRTGTGSGTGTDTESESESFADERGLGGAWVCTDTYYCLQSSLMMITSVLAEGKELVSLLTNKIKNDSSCCQCDSVRVLWWSDSVTVALLLCVTSSYTLLYFFSGLTKQQQHLTTSLW